MGIVVGENIKLIISDFDGVFTDGGAYIDEDGKISKKINFSDVMGIFLLLKSERKLAIISGDKTSAIDYLQQRFGFEDVHQSIRDKVPVVQELMKKYDLSFDEIAYIGDDVNDIESMKLVKYAFAPINANYKVKELENVQILSKNGGNGAFRELVDEILKC